MNKVIAGTIGALLGFIIVLVLAPLFIKPPTKQNSTTPVALVCGQIGGIPHIAYAKDIYADSAGIWNITDVDNNFVMYQKPADEVCIRMPEAMAKQIEDQVKKYLQQKGAQPSGTIQVEG